MDYKLHPLYTEKDRAQALSSIVEYIENNNIPEHYAISNDTFVYQLSETPRAVTEQIIHMQYGVNMISIANALKMQDLFFSKYMPHLARYLEHLGIKHYFSYMRPSIIIPSYIMHLFTTGKRTKPFRYWDSSIEWIDYSYIDGDYERNITNPINNFYHASLNLFGIDNERFIKEIDKLYNIKRGQNIDKAKNLSLKLLPTFNPITMVKVTEAIHKYL